MEKTMCVAKALYDMYYAEKGVHMDEMKMHKLMYFSQRESLMYNIHFLTTPLSLQKQNPEH